MFRKITAFILILAFAAGCFSRVVIVLDYYTNRQAYIVNCVNKLRPEMHCNGKCQLMKKIKEQQNKEQQNEERLRSLKYEVISSRSFFASLIPSSFCIDCSGTATGEPAIYSGYLAPVFHPPGLV